MLTEQKGIQVDKFYPPTDWQYSFPEGYTRLEYLEFTGTQYINTNYVPNNNVDASITASFKNVNGNIHTFIEGGNSWKSNEILICANQTSASGTNGRLIGFKGTDSSFIITSLPEAIPYVNIKHTYEIKDYSFYIDKQLIFTFNTTNINTTNTMYIGAYHRNSGVGEYLIGNVYVCQIWDGGTLVRNFVPAKRNSDNKPGMYDLVNNIFYVNQGTGEFVMGPELYSNNSQIDIRQKNNTNFVEKYKFNENNELVWANPQLNLSGPVNYSVVGSPTIVDGVVSGFSANDYLIINNIPTNISSYEIVCTFTTSSQWKSSNDIILGQLNTNIHTPQLGIDYGNHKLYFSFPNSSHQWVAINTVNALSLNTKYTAKMVWDGITAYAYLQEENGQMGLVGSASLITNGWDQKLCIGNDDIKTAFFTGSIDLKETYIKVNDKLWFYGKNYTSENYAPVPTGLNYNNTTTPSIGYVNIQTQEFIPAPTDGIKYSQTRDIKVIPPEDNTITLLYGVASDFSKYSLFGLVASVSSGTYDVYIDDVLYDTTASGTQTDIDFSTLGAEYVSIGTCTTPEELVLHKIMIKPTTSGETITRFRCARTIGASGTQAQGCLWAHLELKNNIALSALFNAETTTYTNNNLYSVTAKNNTLRAALSNFSFKNTNVVYLPYIIHDSSGSYGIFTSVKCKRIKVNITGNISSIRNFLTEATQLEKLDTNISTQNKLMDTTNNYRSYKNTYKLKQLPCNKFNALSSVNEFVISNTSLYPTKLDISDNKDLTILGTYGTSTYPMRGLRGLKVSNEAPFTGSSPQINVSYTGLDRDALVELFESMPGYMKLTKVGEPTIDSNGVASGFSDSNYLNLNQPFNPDTKKWEVGFRITTGNNLTVSNNIFRSCVSVPSQAGRIGLNINITTVSHFHIDLSFSGTAWDYSNSGPYTVLPNTNYYIKVGWNGNTYYLEYSTDGINYVRDIEYTSNSSLYNGLTVSQIGIYSYGNNYHDPFLGTIDLKNSYITINNARYQFQLPDDTTSRAINITAATGNNLTKVGTGVTIDENGVASGFSANDYLAIPKIIEDGKVELKCKFTLDINVPSSINEELCDFYTSGSTTTGRILWDRTSKKPRIFLRNNTSDEFNSAAVDYAMVRGNTYILKFIYNNEIGSLYLYNENEELLGSVNLQQKFNYKTPIRFGTISTTTSIFTGSIDLENTYIKVDNNYLMKGYLTDNDRLIATNKGWGITG